MILRTRSAAESEISRLLSEAMATYCGRLNRAEAPSANSMVLPAIVLTYPEEFVKAMRSATLRRAYWSARFDGAGAPRKRSKASTGNRRGKKPTVRLNPQATGPMLTPARRS